MLSNGMSEVLTAANLHSRVILSSEHLLVALDPIVHQGSNVSAFSVMCRGSEPTKPPVTHSFHGPCNAYQDHPSDSIKPLFDGESVNSIPSYHRDVV